MRLRTRVVLQLAALCFVLAAYGFADNGYLYVVHAIPGRDVAANFNPGLPVDVLINGKTCIARSLAFGTIDGPFTLAVGTYDVQISTANTLTPCSNAALIESQVTLTSGASVSAVAALSAGSPTLLTLTADLAPVSSGNARFVLAQAADAPALQATLTQVNVKKPKTFTVIASPGDEQAISVPAGTYDIQIAAVGGSTVLTSEQIGLPGQSVTFTYVAGSSANNSVGLVNKTVRDVF
jgi:hypothetical protein